LIISVTLRIFRQGKYPPKQWTFKGETARQQAAEQARMNSVNGDGVYIVTTEKLTSYAEKAMKEDR